jgi:hypothetical protein
MGEVRADDLDAVAREELMELYRRWRGEGEAD